MEALIPGEDGAMSALRRYPQELRDRAVRVVFELRQRTGGQPGAIVRVANQLGVHRIAELEREVRELRRANEILKAASAFFAAELDRPRTR
jgi:transposase